MQLVFENIIGSSEIQFDVLKTICGDTEEKSMVDIGSGNCPVTRLLGFDYRMYIDVVERDLGEEENKRFVKKNILSIINTRFQNKKDCSFSLDNIEHYWEEDARKVIKWMEDNSHKQIIFTPQGRYMNVSDETNVDPDTHKHSWIDKDFQDMGWATITFPNFHPTLGEGGLGAFFAFKCDNLEEEFTRISNELKNKSWTK